jgi:beta-carotene hydroxylase
MQQAMVMDEKGALTAAKRVHSGIAWGCIVYAVIVLALYGWCVFSALSGAIPLWLALIANSFLVYGAYTSVHEAVHGNIAPGNGLARWINPVIGFLSAAPMIHNYTLHQTTHIAHHRHTYDHALDADHWVKGQNGFETLLRCFTIVYAHYRTGWQINRDTPPGRRALLIGTLENLVWLALPIWLGLEGRWAEVLMVIILPGLIGSALLAFFFDYAVHYPLVAKDRFRRGRIYRASPAVQKLITLLYVGQNYHLIHHLYPWVPFYKYPKLFREIETLLRAKGAPIVALGRAG